MGESFGEEDCRTRTGRYLPHEFGADFQAPHFPGAEVVGFVAAGDTAEAAVVFVYVG